jgi:hypothetical protein
MHVTAYAYNAATHCLRCFERYNLARNRAGTYDTDPPAPIFSTDENCSGYCDTCGMAYGDADPVARILSIDAWRDGDGWQWNNWHARGFVPLAWCDLTPRALLRKLRERGCYTLPAPGFARVEDDGHNLVIAMRGTGEPIAAIEYGSVPA